MKRLLPVLLVCGACGSPLAGAWRGTADLGPVRAQALVLTVAEDGQSGKLHLADPGKPEDFVLCRLSRTERTFEAEYDAARPGCDGNAGSPSERRMLKGTVGEGVVWGELWRGNEKLGFFRGFANWVAD